MTLPPRVEPTGDPDEGRTETPRKTPPAPQSHNRPPAELMTLNGDLVRSINSIKQQYREGELGDDEVEAVIEAAAVIRAIAGGVTE